MSEWTLECVLPIEEHARQIMQWRNDPVSLKMSRDQRKKTWDAFFKEFQNTYFSHPAFLPLFLQRDRKRVAFVRFREVPPPLEPHSTCVDISINVAPEARGEGVGAKALEMVEVLLRARSATALLAEIKPENEASIALFKKAGYEKIGKIEKEFLGERILLEHYLRNLNPPVKKEPALIIAEAGSNWKRETKEKSWSALIEMIEAAVHAGADIVKFQLFLSNELYVERAGQSDYLKEGGIVQEIGDLIHDLELPEEWVPKIAKACEEKEIELMVSVFSEHAFAVVDPYVKRHKIASYENGVEKLLELAAKSGKPVLLSTGASTMEEVEWSVNALKSFGCKEIILMQCTASYPAPPKEMNLSVLNNFHFSYNVKVGLSDHSRDPVAAPVAAMAYGTQVIEKHFTLSRDLSGPDHFFSLEPNELKEMVEKIRTTEEMLGDGMKKIEACEEELYAFAKRGVQAVQEIQKGETFKEGKNIAVLRPGKQPKGVHPKYLSEIAGKTSRREIQAGEGVNFDDF